MWCRSVLLVLFDHQLRYGNLWSPHLGLVTCACCYNMDFVDSKISWSTGSFIKGIS